MFARSLAMSPRKRVRPNPAEGAGASSTTSLPLPRANPADPSSRLRPGSEAAASSPNLPVPSAPTQASGTPPPLNGDAPQPPLKQVKTTRSWYGSWPRAPRAKAAPSTQIARESILGGTLKPEGTFDLSRYDAKKVSADPADSAVAADHDDAAVVPTPPHIDENDPSTTRGNVASESAPVGAPSRESTRATEEPAPETHPPAAHDALPASQVHSAELSQRPATSSGWLGWLSRPAVPTAPASAEPPTAEAHKPDTQSGSLQRGQAHDEHTSHEARDPPNAPAGLRETTPLGPQSPVEPTGSSWFGLWPARTPTKQQKADGYEDAANRDDGPTAKTAADSEPPKEQGDVTMQEPPVTSPLAQPAGSTWAFWSRDTKGTPGSAGSSAREPGEIAVMGQGSEAHPQPASDAEVNSAPPAVKEPARVTSSKDAAKKNKKPRPQSTDTDEPGTRPGTPALAASAGVDSASIRSVAQTADSTPKASGTNLLLPSFRATYRMKQNPSILHQIRQLLFRTQQQPPPNHVFLTREPPKIRKALAIGVHGLFPATYLRPMIGQPTGTSIRFANHCAESIRRWADSHGCEGCEIEKVALEGEGKIGDRVENLWKLLLNWIDLIRQADLIVVACHSQGVPVGIMLVAKLIELGIITTPRIGVCAMAGVSLGPFPSYQSGMGMLMGSAAELWEFANPESEVSKRLETSLRVILAYGVRVTYIGSIDDQVVPLESALYSSANHPYLYRAVFVDSRVHAPDFIAHLVGFALKLRNMGVSDHGVIRELSVPLAGSLYSGAGHSTLYDDPQVYDLALSHTLETSDIGQVPCEIRKHEGITSSNPYHLPWIMRGLLEEDLARTELSSEVAELLAQFDHWKPTTKALKDVKYRLEAVRSKL